MRETQALALDLGESPGSNAVFREHAFRRAGRMKFISTVIPSGASRDPLFIPLIRLLSREPVLSYKPNYEYR
jgi:hypothetical protein